MDMLARIVTLVASHIQLLIAWKITSPPINSQGARRARPATRRARLAELSLLTVPMLSDTGSPGMGGHPEGPGAWCSLSIGELDMVRSIPTVLHVRQG